MGKDEDEIVIEIGKLAVVLELLPNPGLIGVRGDLLLQEAADLAEPLLLGLPQGCRHRRRRHGSSAAADRRREGRGRQGTDLGVRMGGWGVRAILCEVKRGGGALLR
ncbi:hypothetical protein COCNU_scaffold013344G000020 [Cocos nucifera]|nr:hypothetical protein [Cocos nucifera]